MIVSIQVGSLLLNTKSSGYALIAEEGLSLPPIRNASFNLPGAHYGAQVASYYGVRRFALTFLVIGATIADYRAKREALHEAFSAMKGSQTLTFTLSGGRTVTLEAVTISMDFALKAGIPSAGEAHIEFEAAFPFFLGELKTGTLTLPIAGGGTVPPPTMPMGLSMGSGGSLLVTNDGNAPSYPTITFAGPVINPAIRNETTGAELRFLLSLAAGDYLTVNARTKQITDGAGTNRYSTKTGDWWTLATGVNNLSFRADSTDPAAHADMLYADTWLAI